ncbi:MAG: polymorphic toxin-type HINT domain-containing protein, partial [Fimbriiglobus sp.]
QTPHGYRGERWDAVLDKSINRARYLDVGTGRFLGTDPYAGDVYDPISLHRFVYAGADPVNMMDPTGMFSVGGMSVSMSLRSGMRGMQGVGQQAVRAHANGMAQGSQASVGTLLESAATGLFEEAIGGERYDLRDAFDEAAEAFKVGYIMGVVGTVVPCSIMTGYNIFNALEDGYEAFEEVIALYDRREYVAATIAVVSAVYTLVTDLKSAKACFAAGTPVRVPGGGFIAVDTLVAGDVILSRSEGDPDGPATARRVLEVFVQDAPIWEVTAGGQVIGTTENHPFWVDGKGWTPTRELSVGDVLVGSDGRRTVVERVVETGRVAAVYGLSVEDDHTYFVGCDAWGFDVWVHNTCEFDKAKQHSEVIGPDGKKYYVTRDHRTGEQKLLSEKEADEQRIRSDKKSEANYYEPDHALAEVRAKRAKERYEEEIERKLTYEEQEKFDEILNGPGNLYLLSFDLNRSKGSSSSEQLAARKSNPASTSKHKDRFGDAYLAWLADTEMATINRFKNEVFGGGNYF